MGVSAVTGEGMDDFFAAVASCARDYEQHYLPELQRRQQVRSPGFLHALACRVLVPVQISCHMETSAWHAGAP